MGPMVAVVAAVVMADIVAPPPVKAADPIVAPPPVKAADPIVAPPPVKAAASARRVGPNLEAAFVKALSRSTDATRVAAVLLEIAQLHNIQIPAEELSRSAELISRLTVDSEVQDVLKRLRLIEGPAADSLWRASGATGEMEEELRGRWRQHAGVFEDSTRVTERIKDVVIVTTASYGHKVYFNNWQCIAKRYGLKYMVLASDQISHALAGRRSVLMPKARSREEVDAPKTITQNSLNFMSCHQLAAVSTLVEAGASVAYVGMNAFFKHDPMQFLSAVLDYDFSYAARSIGCSSGKQDPPGSCLAPESSLYFVNGKKPAVRRMWKAAVKDCYGALDEGPAASTVGGGVGPALQRTMNEVLGLPTHWNKNINSRNYNHLKVPDEWKRLQTSLPASSPFKAAKWCSASSGETSADTFEYCVLEPLKYPGQKHKILGDQVIAAVTNLKKGHTPRFRNQLMMDGVWVWDSYHDGPEGRCMTRANASAVAAASARRVMRYSKYGLVTDEGRRSGPKRRRREGESV